MDEAWVRSMERKMATVETFVKEIRENHLPHISRELVWIKGRLNRGNRPTWAICMMFGALSSLCVGLIIYGVMR